MRFFGKFTVLVGAVRELWILFALVLLTNLAYRLVNFTLSLWLTSDLGYSDEQTGLAVMLWSAGLTLSIVLVGSLTDALGLRKTFLLGFALCIISRVFLTFTTIPWLVLTGGMALLALGEGMGTPVTIAALRRYTTTAQRSIAYQQEADVGAPIPECLRRPQYHVQTAGHANRPDVGAHELTAQSVLRT